MKIDINSLIVILNKLRLYKEIEDKIILNISDTLTSTEKAYISDNNKISDKNMEILNKLKESSNERDKYINYIDNVIKSYSSIDYNEKVKYDNL